MQFCGLLVISHIGVYNKPTNYVLLPDLARTLTFVNKPTKQKGKKYAN